MNYKTRRAHNPYQTPCSRGACSPFDMHTGSKLPGYTGSEMPSKPARGLGRPRGVELLEGRTLLSIAYYMAPGSVSAPASTTLAPAAAAASDIDPTFGSNGAFQTSFDAESVVNQSDGSVVIAGHGLDPATQQPIAMLQRLTPNGSPDPTFNGGNPVFSPQGDGSEYFSAVVQPDGKIVVVGTLAFTQNGVANSRFLIDRFNADGTPDSTFHQGSLSLNFGDAAFSATTSASGQVMALGTATDGFIASDYTSSGSVGATGPVRRDLDTGDETHDLGHDDALSAAVVEANGQIVAAGVLENQIIVLRFNADGSVDTTFGSAGTGIVFAPSLVTTNFGFEPDGVTPIVDSTEGLTLDSAGRILVTNGTAGGDFGVVRMDASGNLDTTFGQGGLATVDFGGTDDSDSVIAQSNGDILLLGTTNAGGTPAIAVATLLPDGNLDTSALSGGQEILPAGVAPVNRAFFTGSFVILHAFGDTQSSGELVVGAGDRNSSTMSSTIRRLTRTLPPPPPTLLGTFGGRQRLTVNENGVNVTFGLQGGTGQAFLDGNNVDLQLVGNDALTIRTTKGGRVSLGSITVQGNLNSMSAPLADLAGTLTVSGNVGAVNVGNITGVFRAAGSINSLVSANVSGTVSCGGTLGAIHLAGVTGTVAAGQRIRSLNVGSLTGATVLAGADLGANGVLGGGDDAFAAGSITLITVRGQISTSFVGAGINPTDGVFGNGNDQLIGGTASALRQITAAGCDAASKFEAGAFGAARLGKRVTPATDPRFVRLS